MNIPDVNLSNHRIEMNHYRLIFSNVYEKMSYLHDDFDMIFVVVDHKISLIYQVSFVVVDDAAAVDDDYDYVVQSSQTDPSFQYR